MRPILRRSNPLRNIRGLSAAGWLRITLTVTISSAAEPADLNNDGHVDGADLAMLLNQWGTNGTADLDHDSLVGGSDLAILLNAWG